MTSQHDNSRPVSRPRSVLTIRGTIHVPRSEFQFSYTRSGGPGGQHVNKVSTKAELRWDITRTSALPEDVRQRFIRAYGSRITQEGEVVITSDRHRSRTRNTEDCVARLLSWLNASAEAPRRRKKTKPSRAQKQKRLSRKRRQAQKKRTRSKVSGELD